MWTPSCLAKPFNSPGPSDPNDDVGIVDERIRAYIADFDSGLKHDEFNSPRFSYRLLFHKKLVNRPGQADRVIE